MLHRVTKNTRSFNFAKGVFNISSHEGSRVGTTRACQCAEKIGHKFGTRRHGAAELPRLKKMGDAWLDNVKQAPSCQFVGALEERNGAYTVVRLGKCLDVSREPDSGHDRRDPASDPVIGPKSENEGAKWVSVQQMQV